ncbi:MAG: flavin reductase family protein [Deltaproteobacteria bacterium]|jgi:flavin reductase (DIM6/NTAB) family NADH-FMN oxidoreductase RutF|nr:flavin reductase family protein [Deltaproteobacteria bacterium]
MELDPSALDRQGRYRLMTAAIVPRPIAWISTLSAEGHPNLAPFSFFGAVSSEPPIVSLSVGRRRGQKKDTAQNLLATGEGVLHIVSATLARAMVHTSAEVGPEVDEFELASLTKAPAQRVKPWRIAEAKMALEVRVLSHQEVGRGPVDLFLLEIVWVHLDESILSDGLPDPVKLEPTARLGGQLYATICEVFELPRPE